MAGRQVAIHLEVTQAGESLTGSARDDGGAERRFEGRLGLLAAIDALVLAAQDDAVNTREGA